MAEPAWELIDVGVSDSPLAQCWQCGNVRVIVAKEGGRWHISISRRDRYPSWDEIADARYHFVGDAVDMALLLPPKQDYVNAAPLTGIHVFHLWEIHDLELPVERGLGHIRTTESGEQRS